MKAKSCIRGYFQESFLHILSALLLISLIDLVLLVSTPLGMATGDIIYLNLLIGSAASAVWTAGYFRFSARFLRLRQSLDVGECIDYLLPQDSSFYSVLLRDAVTVKSDEYAKSISLYQGRMDELNDYITKWIHEIKIPISTCELILENGDLSKADAARNVKLQLERTRFLINQVLYAGRAAYYNEDLSVNEFDLAKAVREAVKRSAQSFILKDIEVNISPFEFCVGNDEKWVSYILDQILNNASKYTRRNGKVEIYANEDEKAVRLHILDNGIGIPQHDISRIFDKGFTGDNGRKITKSTGMGMYYSKKMADRLGIGIEVNSNAGEYTEFILVFYKVRDYFRE